MLAWCVLGSPTASTETAKVYFVPELRGSITVDVTYEGRFDGVLTSDTHGLPSEAIRLHAGYLHYLDGHGRAAVGGYLGGGATVGEGPVSSRADAGALFRLRGISDEWFHVSLAAFAEGGLLSSRARAAECETCDALGTRFASGLEVGGGVLWYLAPYIFGEYAARLGVETVRLDGRSVWAVFGAMRLNFDFALRRGEPR